VEEGPSGDWCVIMLVNQKGNPHCKDVRVASGRSVTPPQPKEAVFNGKAEERSKRDRTECELSLGEIITRTQRRRRLKWFGAGGCDRV